MPDYKKTEQLFKEREISHLYHKPAAQLDDELFYAKITNPETGQPYQWDDLTVSNRKFANGKKYPIREVFQIVRVRRPDASEWLKSRGRIVGLDQLGNEVEHSFNDPEVYFKPWTEYKIRKNAQNPDGPKERYCAAAGINERSLEHKEYTLPFNAKNFEALYKQRSGQSSASVSLVIMDEGATEGPRQITSVEQFKNTPFEDLWQEAITPKFKLDRSYKDNLDANHIR